MKAHIQWRPSTDAYDLWLYTEAPNGTRRVAKFTGEDTLTDVEYAPYEEAPPTLRLHRSVYEALAEAFSDFPPPSKAMADALDDTRSTRDRLLAIVEAVAAE